LVSHPSRHPAARARNDALRQAKRASIDESTHIDYERLKDTFGAFMRASRSSSYGNLPWPPRFSWLACLGCYAGVMTVTLHLDGAVAEALAAEAARRGQTADELAAALLAAQLPKAPRRRLAFAAVGASTSGRGAAEADEMLAEGFGRD
jgi:hypothetical protein